MKFGRGSMQTLSRLLVARAIISEVRMQPKRDVSQRSWKVIRYHSDLKEAVKLSETNQLPVVTNPDGLLVKVLASSVNKLDVAMTRGKTNAIPYLSNMVDYNGFEPVKWDRLPITLGRDFVGQIMACGKAVWSYKPGDLVWGIVPPYENGSHTDFLVTSDKSVSIKPSNLTNVEAAALPYVGLTAWSAITVFGQLNALKALNKNVLVMGGSGGVGCFAVQLLKYWGANVTTTCSKDSLEWLSELAKPNQCIDYQQTKDFLNQYPNTFDFILDASSPSASRKNYEIIADIVKRNPAKTESGTGAVYDKKKTTYVTLNSPLLQYNEKYGLSSETMGTVTDALVDSLSCTHRGINFRWAHYRPNANVLSHLATLVERGAIKPFGTNVYDFDKAIEAYEAVERVPRPTKVVLSFVN